MHSGWFDGHVVHQRRSPRHGFRKHLSMALVALDELPALRASRALPTGRFASRSLREADLLADEPGETLDERVRDAIAARCGRRPDGRILLLSQLRCWGLAFDPVRFFFCLSADGTLDAALAEVTNTPWDERYCYAFDARDAAAAVRSGAAISFDAAKAFHVSPFMPMAQRYRFRFEWSADAIHVAITNREADEVVFHAELALERATTGLARRWRDRLRHPWMTAESLVAIYAQAALLLCRRAPFHAHPVPTPVPVARIEECP